MNKSIVYLVRKRAMGDVLWLEPIIRQLSVRYHKVIVFSKYNELFANYPLSNVVFKDKLTLFEKVWCKLEEILKISIFFVNLENAYEENPKIHLLHAYQKKAGLELTEQYPLIYLNESELMSSIVPDCKYIILHLESLTEKNYRKVFGIDWNIITNYLINKGIHVVQIGKHSLNIPGTQYKKTSIREMMILIKKSLFFIGIDSGPSHIATSLGTPALIFFGAVNPEFRHFKKLFNGSFLQQYCEYAGCYHNIVSRVGPDCRLVGNKGIPKCSLHTNEFVISHIDSLMKKINYRD